ncbi:ABC transporter substrate-binding protein [Pseudoroseicyclus sp. H15]
MTIDFVVATPHDAVHFNDVFRNYTASAGYIVCNNIYNRMVLTEWYNFSGSYPDLATHWEMLDGARRWRFHLNQAARWQDGEKLTARDVVYTHTHVMKMGYTGAMFLTDVDHIEMVNDYTVDYHLKAPNAGFLVQLGNFIFSHFLPAHLYEGTDWETNPYNMKPVGSGPFRLVEWAKGEHIIMEAVKDHWGPQPEIDRLILKIEPDRDECVRMVTRGEAHFFPQDTLTLDRMHLVEGADVEIMRGKGPGMALLDFNHGSGDWDDQRRRDAVAHAVNRADIEKITDPGYSFAWPHYLLETVEWAFNPEAVAPDHDVAKSKELLDEAGLPEGEDGIRKHLNLYFMETFFGHKRLADIVKANLEAVGFSVNVEGLSSVDWSRKIRKEHDFDLIIVGGTMAPDPEITSTKYSSTGLNNMGQHHNADVDAAYADARSALTRKERGEHYKRLQEVLARDCEYVPLLWYATYYARSKEFFGWADQLEYSVPWWHWGRIRPVAKD